MKENIRSFLNKPCGMPVVLVVLGAALILFPGMALKTIVRLGGVAMVAGGANAVGAWKRSQNQETSSYLDVAGGVVAILGGLYLVIRPESLINFFPTLAGALIVVSGIYYILKAMDSKRAGFDKWQVSLLLSVVTIALGILILAHPFGTMELLVRILGGVLVYNGLSSLWIVTH